MHRDPSAVRDTLARILSAPEFSDEPSWLERFLKGFFETIRVVLASLPFWLQIVILIAATTALVLVIWSMVRGYGDASDTLPRSRIGAEGLRAVSLVPMEALRDARALFEKGELRLAARAVEQALILHLCTLRGAAFTSSLSDWEWMDRLSAEPWMRAFTRRAEAIAYGPRPEPAELERCFEELSPHLERPS